MSFYPAAIQQRLNDPSNAGGVASADASGRSASFVCGCSVRFAIRLDKDGKTIKTAAFNTNGCGYMVAAADVLAETITGKQLSELHSLDQEELATTIENDLLPFPTDRKQCGNVCIEALRETFADLRARRREEFTGEKALVCTCFGVLEETIAAKISERSLHTVEQVTDVCNAGGGCGSCRMLIQEMLDAEDR